MIEDSPYPWPLSAAQAQGVIAATSGFAYPTSDAQLQTATGLAQSASGLWLPGVGLEDLIGSNDLTESGTVAYGSDEVIGSYAQVSEAAAGALTAASGYNPGNGTNSIVVGGVFVINAISAAGQDPVIGNGAAGAPYYELRVTTSALRAITSRTGETNTSDLTLTAPDDIGIAIGAAVALNFGAGTTTLLSTLGNGTPNATTGDWTQTQALAFGGAAPPNVKASLLFAYEGAAAEAFTAAAATHLANLLAAIGL